MPVTTIVVGIAQKYMGLIVCPSLNKLNEFCDILPVQNENTNNVDTCKPPTHKGYYLSHQPFILGFVNIVSMLSRVG